MQFTATQKSAATWAVMAAFVIFLLWLLAPVLTPFVVAAVFAYALTPLVNRLDRRRGGRVPRLLAVLLVQFLLFVAILGVALLIVPILAKELPLMRDQVPVLFDRFNSAAKPFLARFDVALSLDVANIKAFVLKYLNANFEDAFGSMMASLKLGGSVAFAIIGNAILIPVALFYLLMDWDRFVGSVKHLVPPRMRASVDSFTQEADAVLGQYLRGQLLVMLILAVIFALLAFGQLLGFVGVLIALPVSAVLLVAMRRVWQTYLGSHLYQGDGA